MRDIERCKIACARRLSNEFSDVEVRSDVKVHSETSRYCSNCGTKLR